MKDIPISAWFAGPKAENSDAFAGTIQRILADHQYWRRNYFPEDGVVITSEERRSNSHWNDLFEDKLMELLAALKAHYPVASPRYAAHMVSEQTLPSIAAYFAGMLYNPNNVTREAAPVTVQMELEAGRMIAEMLGYEGETCWAHLTGGGTVANLEALWVARTVKYLPFLLKDVLRSLNLDHPLRAMDPGRLLGMPPTDALNLLLECFQAAEAQWGATPETVRRVIEAYTSSDFNVMHVGMGPLCTAIGSEPVVLIPESHHYCFPKNLDILGLGQRALVRVRVDRRFKMDPEDLRKKLDAVEVEGKHVLAVVSVMGTTEEGAIDPIDKILDVRAEREAEGASSFWVHADAAYGGYLRTTILPERTGLGARHTEVRIEGKRMQLALDLPDRETCDALERLGESDSIVVDPHKLGFIPYPAGAVCFKSNLVRPILRQSAPYLEEAPEAPEAERSGENIGVYILEGSKPGAAAAAVWLSHKTIPLDTSAHGYLVKQTIRNACELHVLLDRWTSLHGEHPVQAEVLCAPETNIVCFAFRPRKGAAALPKLNQLNKALYHRFSLPERRRIHVYDQHFFLSRTVLSAAQYSSGTVSPFLQRMGVTITDYEANGVFLLRSTLMNPWYEAAKSHGRYYLVGLVDELHNQAAEIWSSMSIQQTRAV
ncbi:MAG: pyridoxal phosphate-dependent decarboxylase family protein [Rhodothermales bacterium]